MTSPKCSLLAVLLILSVPGIVCAQSQTLDNSVSGFTEPYRSIEVAAPEMGTLSEISVEEGALVKVGSVLARMDESVLNASLAMAQQSSEAKGNLKIKIAQLKTQEKRLEKLLGLQERRHASQTEIDRAESQLEIANAEVEAVEDELRIKSHEIKRIEAQLEQRRLRSPINGIVVKITKDEGEFVSANDPVVMQVVQLDPILVIFSVPQTESREIEAGNTLPIKIGVADERALGFVEFVSPTVNAQSGTRRVKVRIDNPNYKWHSGVSCRLEIPSIATVDDVSQSKMVSSTK